MSTESHPAAATDGFLAIAVDNTSMHYYDGVAALIDDVATDPKADVTPMECFDNEGFRLAFELDAVREPAATVRTDAAADVAALQNRIAQVIQHSRGELDKVRIQVSAAEARLDELAAMDYAATFEALQHQPDAHGPVEDPDDREWIHNCLRHGKCL